MPSLLCFFVYTSATSMIPFSRCLGLRLMFVPCFPHTQTACSYPSGIDSGGRPDESRLVYCTITSVMGSSPSTDCTAMKDRFKFSPRTPPEIRPSNNSVTLFSTICHPSGSLQVFRWKIAMPVIGFGASDSSPNAGMESESCACERDTLERDPALLSPAPLKVGRLASATTAFTEGSEKSTTRPSWTIAPSEVLSVLLSSISCIDLERARGSAGLPDRMASSLCFISAFCTCIEHWLVKSPSSCCRFSSIQGDTSVDLTQSPFRVML
mmetsp:Transcript_876/g.2275  ORF Transcript_876/g.2275 Transcript_876/m.2275 type:complete len:267 (-) Transcript_876:430-1230(-)